jgi:hypothetical protein
MTKVGRWLRLALLVPGAMLLWSCTAPVFPVPPPAEITFIPTTLKDQNGTERTLWVTQGGPLDQAASATYYVLNRALGSGVFTTAQSDGSFVAPAMDGNAGDAILINYRTPIGDYSDSTCRLLADAASAPLCPP